MKVNDPNLQGPGSLTSTGVSRASGAAGGASARASQAHPGQDGVELSSLAQNLRAEDGESPERLAQVERLAKAYAQGTYQADSEATAGGVIDDALKHR